MTEGWRRPLAGLHPVLPVWTPLLQMRLQRLSLALQGAAPREAEAWRTQWVDSKWSRKHPGWDDEGEGEGVPVHRVEGKAGDCILFTSVPSPSLELCRSC